LFQGIEKKTAKLKGSEKAVVARHEVGHAVVGTAVASLLPGQPRVEVNHRKYSILDHLNMPIANMRMYTCLLDFWNCHYWNSTYSLISSSFRLCLMTKIA